MYWYHRRNGSRSRETESTYGERRDHTALFVVMFLNQWEEAKDHRPALVGLICSAVCLLIFRSSNFIVPSMIFIIVCFTAERKLSKKPEVAAK